MPLSIGDEEIKRLITQAADDVLKAVSYYSFNTSGIHTRLARLVEDVLILKDKQG